MRPEHRRHARRLALVSLGGTVADILATPASRIVHVHVSDAKQMPPEEVQDTMRWLPGEGIIDLVGFFQALKQIGYRRRRARDDWSAHP